MVICKHCGIAFRPIQSFKHLFASPSTCEGCVKLLERPLRSESVPLKHNTLILFTHDHPSRPALIDDVIETLSYHDVFVVFYETLQKALKEEWSLIRDLLHPVVLYHADFPTLDHLERWLKWFDDEM